MQSGSSESESRSEESSEENPVDKDGKTDAMKYIDALEYENKKD